MNAAFSCVRDPHIRLTRVSVCFAGQLYGLEKFWAFLKYSRRNVNVDPKLRQWLANYQRLEDFRVDVSARKHCMVFIDKFNC